MFIHAECAQDQCGSKHQPQAGMGPGYNSNCHQCVAERVAVMSRPGSPEAQAKMALSQSTHSIQPRLTGMKHHSGINQNSG